MTALTGALAEAMGEAERDAREALYVVASEADAEALTTLGYCSAVAARTDVVLDAAALVADRGLPVVFVGSVGAAVRAEIRMQVPTARLLRMWEPESPALALNIMPSVRMPTAEELTAPATTWLSLAMEARPDTDPAAEATDDGSADYVPPPVHVLPRSLRQFVERGAEAQAIDAAFFLVPCLGALAGAIGATRRVALKDGWQEPAVLWTAIVAPSGAGKSPPLKAAVRPVAERNHILHERSEALRQAYEAEREARRGDRGGASDAPLAEPATLRAMVRDTTLEALGVRLRDNRRGLLVAVDELAQWLGSFDRYRRGADGAAWLSLYDADALQVDRRGEGSLLVRSAAVSVTGSIQPAVARRVLASEQHCASGLAARILMAAPPVTAPRWTDHVLDGVVLHEYRRLLDSLLDLELDASGEPVVLALTDEAREVFAAFVNDSGATWLDAVRHGEADLSAALAKQRGVAARLALVLCLARHAEDGAAAMARKVHAADVRGGIALARWFGGEAARLYRRWGGEAAQESADRERGTATAVADRLAKYLPAGQRRSLRELHGLTGNNLPGALLRAGLAILVASGRAFKVPPDRSRPGRPAEVWEGRGGECS